MRGPLLLIGAFAALALATRPDAAHAAVTASTAGAQLSITLSAADDVAVTCSGGQVRVNGAAPSPGPAAACSAITKVVVVATGDFANTIDLSGVGNAAGFTNLLDVPPSVDALSGVPLAIEVDTGPGSDTITPSNDDPLGQRIVGGLGSDTLNAGNGTVQFHFLDNGPIAETDVITANPVLGRFGLELGIVTANVTVDLNGGVGGNPLAIMSDGSRVVAMAAIDQAVRCTRILTGSGDDAITMRSTMTDTEPFFTILGSLGGSDTFVGGPRDEQYLFAGNNGVKTITDTSGDNMLGFCNCTSAVTVDLAGGLGATQLSSGCGTTVQLANAGDTATREQFTRIEGGTGNDLLIGNTRDNLFTDCGGNDEMRGGPGNDTFDERPAFVKFNTGSDRYEGGPGNDTYRFTCNGQPGAVTDTVVELPGEGDHDALDFQDTPTCQAGVVLNADLRVDGPIGTIGPPAGAAKLVVQTGAAGQAANFEDVNATPTAGDVLIGNDADNRLVGSAGDTLDGKNGNDTLSGGTMLTGPGNDSFSNGIVSFAAIPGPVFVDLRAGVATGDGTDTLQGISRVIGTAAGDTMIARGVFGDTTILDGMGGSDTLQAEFGAVLNGGEGEDTLRAGGGTVANGGNGNDTIHGVFFTGTLNGDAGDDTFILANGNRTVNGGTGVDTIDTRNEVPDTVNCGSEVDVVRGDDFDTVAGDCESVNPGPAPGPPATTDLALLSCGDVLTTFAGASADGTRVVFSTTASLAAADVDGATDLYSKDGDEIFLISGGVANVAPTFDAISPDGTRVIFTTTEAIPGTGDGDTKSDIYQWQNGVRTLLTPGTPDDDIFVYVASPDASRIFFTTKTALVPADTDANSDAYERSGGTYTLLSAPGTTPNSPPGFTFPGLLSADGSRVYFTSDKALLPEDTDTDADLYERSPNGLRLISGASLLGGFGVIAFPIAVTPNGSHIYFSTDKRLVVEDAATGFGAFDLYVRDASGLALIGGPDSNTNLLAASPDGARVLIFTRVSLLPADTDDAVDVYAYEGGTYTLLSGGSDDLDLRNMRAATDASAVVFQTDEALLPADTDTVDDVYRWENGTLTLITPGSAEIPAVFRDATADLGTIFFRTAESLDAADTDAAIDLYANTGGTVSLIAAGTAARSAIYRGKSADGSVVFFDSSEVLLGADTDGTTDLYVVGPGGYPAQPVCEVIVTEDCANCIDDDGDLLVDRDDPECGERADGGGVGLPDAKLQGKPAVGCQKALGKAGAKHAAATLKRLQKCVGATFTCVQKKPGDAKCLTKASTTCAKLLAGRAADRGKLAAAIGKACAPPKLAVVDLQDETGLGFAAEVAGCAPFGGGTLTSAAEVATCVAMQHQCRAEALIGEETPRAFELLGLAGRTPAVETPCLAPGVDGGGAGIADAKVGTAVAKCGAAIGKAGLKLLGQRQKAAQGCALAIASCRQQKPADAKCLPKAQGKCGKAFTKLADPVKGAAAKLAAALGKSCGAPKVAIADVIGATGVGFDARAEQCALLGVSTLATAADIASCVAELHQCRADQLLELQTPRLRELLTDGGVTLP